MKRRRILASLTAGLLVLHMAASIALAYDWDLTNGNIIIETTTDSQTVEQGATKKEDKNPVITSNGAETENYIHITVKETGATAELTIENVKGGSFYAQSSADSAGSVAVDLTVKEENTFEQYVGTVGSGEASLHITAGGEGASLETGSIYCTGNKDAEMVIDGMNITAKYIEVGSEGNATLEIKDSTVNSVSSTNNGCGVLAQSSGGNTEIKITDSEVTASGQYGGIVTYAEKNATVTITDSSVISEGDNSVFIGSNTSDAKLTIDNSDVKVVDTGASAATAAVFVGSNNLEGQATIELKNCALADPEQSIGMYEYEENKSTKTFATVLDKDGAPVYDGTVRIVPKAQKNIEVIANADGSFTIKGARLSHFQNLKVNGKQLSAGDFTLTEADGVLILTFSDSFLAGLAQGVHTAEINFGKGYAIFTITK